jgi:hypothetical protein
MGELRSTSPSTRGVIRQPGAQPERWDRTLTTVPAGSRSIKRRTPPSSSRRDTRSQSPAPEPWRRRRRHRPPRPRCQGRPCRRCRRWSPGPRGWSVRRRSSPSPCPSRQRTEQLHGEIARRGRPLRPYVWHRPGDRHAPRSTRQRRSGSASNQRNSIRGAERRPGAQRRVKAAASLSRATSEAWPCAVGQRTCRSRNERTRQWPEQRVHRRSRAEFRLRVQLRAHGSELRRWRRAVCRGRLASDSRARFGTSRKMWSLETRGTPRRIAVAAIHRSAVWARCAGA